MKDTFHRAATGSGLAGAQYDHILSVAAMNTGDETISGPILDFIRAH